MINKIIIENFRGIPSLEVDQLKRISVFSGKNNVGKSTLLEALFLLMDHVSNDSFAKLNNFRGLFLSDVTTIWEPLFHNMDLDEAIKISTEDSDGLKRNLIYKKDTNYIPQSTSVIPEDVIAQFRATSKESYSLVFTYDEGEYKEEGHFAAGPSGILRQMTTSKPGNEIKKLKSTRFINPTNTRTTETVVDGIGKLELSNNKSIIIDILRELDPDIDDIVTISKQNVSQLHIRVKDRWIPLQYAGDGVMKMLHICLEMLERKNGLLLIDEIETGFHYSMYSKLWKIINKISKESDCQIIATTHSYEMISAITGITQDMDDIVYYRMGKSKDTISAHRYDYNMLDNALKSEMEVR